MKKIHCDCCKRQIYDFELIYSIEIKCGNDEEHILEDVCPDCYKYFRDVIDNAEIWRNNRN